MLGLILGLLVYHLAFSVGAGNLNVGPHLYMISILPTDPYLQAFFFLTVKAFKSPSNALFACAKILRINLINENI